MEKANSGHKTKSGPAVKITKTRSLVYCLLAYLVALAAAVACVYYWPGLHPLLVTAIADIAATLVIFVFSAVLNNSSCYDPYWSVAPVFIAGYWFYLAVSHGLETGTHLLVPVKKILVLVLLLFWATRLTGNWIRRWQGLQHEDWRYADYRRLPLPGYWFVSFTGFHLLPTCLVYLGCIPLYFIFTYPSGTAYGLDLVALLVTLTAIWLEHQADNELYRFLKKNKDPTKILDTGLWAYSRHPNYFGEVLFWWGIFLFSLNNSIFHWWTIIGPVGITLLFLFISIPLMDKHMLKKRPAYAEHLRRRSGFIPWFPKNK